MRRILVKLLPWLSVISSVQYFPDSPATDENGYAASITKNPLRPIFENVFNAEEGAFMATNDTWRIHDPSAMVEIDGILTLFATGKETADGYPCAVESWYMFPGETGWRPGNCIWTSQSVRPKWWDDILGRDGYPVLRFNRNRATKNARIFQISGFG